MTAYGFKAGQSTGGIGYEEEVAQTLNGQMSALEPTVFTKAKRASSPTDDESWVPGEVAPTLNSFDNAGESRATVVAISENQRGEIVTTDHAHSLSTGGGKPGSGYPAVLTESWTGGAQQDQFVALDDVAPTLAHSSNHHGGHHEPKVITTTAVRRLTPTECERLMGWPDDHTRWRANGTECADSTRYRMCGNGVASPVAQWIADMINHALQGEQ